MSQGEAGSQHEAQRVFILDCSWCISTDLESWRKILCYVKLWFWSAEGYLAAVVVIRRAGWVLQDVLQVVRQWAWW